VNGSKNAHDIQFRCLRGHNIPADLKGHSIRPERFVRILNVLVETKNIERNGISEHSNSYELTEIGKNFYRTHFNPELDTFIETIYFPHSIKETLEHIVDIPSQSSTHTFTGIQSITE
jgi:hypothetical protein